MTDWPANGFELFWAAYPRKVAKKTARLAMSQVEKSREVTFERLMEMVKAYASSVAGKDIQFVPYPATWLRAGRWDDELPVQPVAANDFTWKALRGTTVSKYS